MCLLEINVKHAFKLSHSALGHIFWRAVPVNLVFAVTVDAGVAQALVDLREAGGVVVTIRTNAGEAVDAVDAGASVATGVDCTFIDVNVAHRTWNKK